MFECCCGIFFYEPTWFPVLQDLLYLFLIIYTYYYWKNEIKKEIKSLKKKNYIKKKINKKIKIIFWWEIWSYFNSTSKLENTFNTPWNMYKKYRYSIWNNWHILEDRICLFIIFFLFYLL